MGTKSFSGVFNEVQTEGIFGGKKRGHFRRKNGGHFRRALKAFKKGRKRAFSEGKKEGILGGPIKRAREGTKRAKPETVIYPNDDLICRPM